MIQQQNAVKQLALFLKWNQQQFVFLNQTGLEMDLYRTHSYDPDSICKNSPVRLAQLLKDAG